MYCVWVKERSKRMVHLSGVLSRAFNVRMRWDTNEINEAVYRIMSKQRGDQLNTFYFLLINKRWPINSDRVCNFWYFLLLVFFFVWWSDSINIEKIKRYNKKGLRTQIGCKIVLLSLVMHDVHYYLVIIILIYIVIDRHKYWPTSLLTFKIKII